MVKLADMDLLGVLAQVREQRPAALSPGQALRMHRMETLPTALPELYWIIEEILNQIEVKEIVPQHPIIGALSTLSHHPQLPEDASLGLPEPKLSIVREALTRRSLEWSAQQLEWQLCQYLTVEAGESEVDLRKGLGMHFLANDTHQTAWTVLMDVTVLRAKGLL